MRISARKIASAALIAFAVPPAAQGASSDGFYCDERKLGTHFYCNPEAPKESRVGASVKQAGADALEEVASIRARLEALRAEAVLRPTTQSVSAYIRFQREQLDRASLFSDVWRRALWMDPSLDYNLERPVAGLSKRAWLDTRRQEQAGALAKLNRRYGLFYFYAASCSACAEFSPVLRSFADRYGISVKAVSLDGGPNRHFPEAAPDAGRMARLGLAGAPVPAVAMFDTQTRRVTPVAFGVVAQSDLEERLFILAEIEPGEDY